ncbi:MAG: hypothetical protein L0216_21760 [Planctomycetales bacterium]|nr:hypothetical protein [Planctomycetales bacterium]
MTKMRHPSTSREFLFLHLGDAKGALQVRPAHSSLPVSGQIFGLIRGEVAAGEILDFEWASGSHVFDLVGTGFAGLHLISERLVSQLTSANLTGWMTAEARVTGKGGRIVEGLRRFIVSGRCGPIDYARSEIMIVSFPGGPGRVRRGLYFDQATWDGSDVFSPQGSGITLVTTDFKRMVEEQRVSNVRLTPLSRVERLLMDHEDGTNP